MRVFFALLRATRDTPRRPFLLSDSKFYERANEILLGLDALPNVVHYAVDGDTHSSVDAGPRQSPPASVEFTTCEPNLHR